MSWIVHFWNLKWKSKINLDFYHFSIKVPKVAVEFWFNLLALTNFGMPVELWLWNICSKALTFFSFWLFQLSLLNVWRFMWRTDSTLRTEKRQNTSRPHDLLQSTPRCAKESTMFSMVYTKKKDFFGKSMKWITLWKLYDRGRQEKWKTSRKNLR